MIINFAEHSANSTYHLLTQLIIPRPIAWVLTRNSEDAGEPYNVAPFSYFNAVASAPPLLMLSCAPKPDGQLKDTAVNILRDKQFVVHIPSQNQLASVQETAAPLPYGQSELTGSNLSTTGFAGSNLPRIARCPVAFNCQLYRTEVIGDAPQTLIFGEITAAYITDTAVNRDGKRLTIDSQQLSPLARLGAGRFAATLLM
ncbi:MAG: hypothetical protein CSA44_02380 [Gammaproteobacteria bacterium]|nr:MAG: hypothetical protein CSA44_02380 [Gammaproteobacteria bacterium]